MLLRWDHLFWGGCTKGCVQKKGERQKEFGFPRYKRHFRAFPVSFLVVDRAGPLSSNAGLAHSTGFRLTPVSSPWLLSAGLQERSQKGREFGSTPPGRVDCGPILIQVFLRCGETCQEHVDRLIGLKYFQLFHPWNDKPGTKYYWATTNPVVSLTMISPSLLGHFLFATGGMGILWWIAHEVAAPRDRTSKAFKPPTKNM